MSLFYQTQCSNDNCTRKVYSRPTDTEVYCFLCEKKRRYEETKRVVPKPDTYAFPSTSRSISPPLRRREGGTKRGLRSPLNTSPDAKRLRVLEDLSQSSHASTSFAAGSPALSSTDFSHKMLCNPSQQAKALRRHVNIIAADSPGLSTNEKSRSLLRPQPRSSVQPSSLHRNKSSNSWHSEDLVPLASLQLQHVERDVSKSATNNEPSPIADAEKLMTPEEVHMIMEVCFLQADQFLRRFLIIAQEKSHAPLSEALEGTSQ